MSDVHVLAIIPARAGSKGILNKNFRWLPGALSPVDLAIRCVEFANVPVIVVTTDVPERVVPGRASQGTLQILERPVELAQDATPMRDVVVHVLESVPGPPDQIILLVQPTQPLRTAAHLRAAVELIQHGARYVISVTETESADKCFYCVDGELYPWEETLTERRQDVEPMYRRDGTVYAWRRKDKYWAYPATALIIPPEETCKLDTPFDWTEAERRLTLSHLSAEERHVWTINSSVKGGATR